MSTVKKPGFALRVNQEITNLFKQYGRPKKYAKGDTVIKQGDYSNYVYILLVGEAEVVRIDRFGNENKLAVLTAGDIVGEMGAFLNNTRSATVKAKTDGLIALECPNQMFIRGLFNTHELTYRVLANYANRINDLNIAVTNHFQSRVMLVVGHYIMSRMNMSKETQDVEIILAEFDEISGLETNKIIEALYNYKSLRTFDKIVFPAEINIIEIEVEKQNVGDETADDGNLKSVEVKQAEPGRVIVGVNTERMKAQMKRLSYC